MFFSLCSLLSQSRQSSQCCCAVSNTLHMGILRLSGELKVLQHTQHRRRGAKTYLYSIKPRRSRYGGDAGTTSSRLLTALSKEWGVDSGTEGCGRVGSVGDGEDVRASRRWRMSTLRSGIENGLPCRKGGPPPRRLEPARMGLLLCSEDPSLLAMCHPKSVFLVSMSLGGGSGGGGGRYEVAFGIDTGAEPAMGKETGAVLERSGIGRGG